MFSIAIVIGILSYSVFLLGLIGFLYKEVIIGLILVFVFAISFYLKNKYQWSNFKDKVSDFSRRLTKLELLFLLLISTQAFVNLIGVLGPELGFDALWYHLTLPKIYLLNHSVEYIPGGLFYYSAMPRFTEMLYAIGLSFGNEITVKVIHFCFGILTLIALYSLSRKFLSKLSSFLVLVLFYSNLVVGWMSISAYIDLARTFFEIMAIWGFINYIEKKETKWLISSAVLLGFAISTKLLALGSLIIFMLLIIVFVRKITIVLIYLFFSLLVSLPWFIFSYVHTANPIFPFFSSVYPVKLNLNMINPLNLSDPISPLYIIFVPIALFSYRKLNPRLRIISSYSFLAIAAWSITPQTGGGRFILPYLPVLSLLTIVVINTLKKNRLRSVFIGAIIFLALFSIFYRGAANLKYVPVILGKESKSEFLSKHLNFTFGDFYDVDGYFSKQIKPADNVLLYGFHNLYYANFPFIDSSYVRNGDKFNYVAVQGNNFPTRFKWWNLIYYNKMTDVRIYSIGGLKWAY